MPLLHFEGLTGSKWPAREAQAYDGGQGVLSQGVQKLRHPKEAHNCPFSYFDMYVRQAIELPVLLILLL